MRRVALGALGLALALSPAPSFAQAFYHEAPPPRGAQVTGSVTPAGQPIAPGSLGGGFIEFLMTGRDPTPAARPSPDPQAMPRVMRSREPEPARDPFTGEPVRRQMAALPQRGEIDRPIERVLDPRFERQQVAYTGPHRPGTIIIDTNQKFLFLVQEGGQALRYGIGVGRPGFEWKGVKSITRKAEWPDWRPPEAMLRRRPDLPRFMEGGLNNPLGARALYLGSSLYRIHGTNEPHTIGQAVSSGCFRMTNDDVIDLYNRVRVGMRVIVI
jgi:lipoprotein-anchoring transpeptidase ErfK/SrfK